jgi:protein-histidine N-methyltransferase
MISYTPLIITSRKEGLNSKVSSDIRPIIIPHRDLYDARFQIISEGALSDEEDEENDGMETEETPQSSTLPPLILDRRNHPRDLEYIDAPSDVIPNIYEGGLKTWECCIDVVGYLSQLEGLPFRGRAVLEVGCGTAMPTAYLLQSLFNEATHSSEKRTSIHLQDYNKSVLELVTLPNLILAWCKHASHETQVC